MPADVTLAGVDAGLVHVAHADAWEAHGQFRRPAGGDVTRLPGIRLMATGLPHPQWNNGDVTDAALVEIDAVRAWYAARRTASGDPVPWGIRIRRGRPWPYGRHLFTKRLMGLAADEFQPAVASPDVMLRMAGPEDADAVVAVDTVAFDAPEEEDRPWIEPMLDQPGMHYCVAEVDGKVVGCGSGLRTDGDAGPALHVAGIAVLPEFRSRGIGAAVSSHVVELGLAAGASFAHLHPDTDQAARIYQRLGFTEVDGFDVYVDLA